MEHISWTEKVTGVVQMTFHFTNCRILNFKSLNTNLNISRIYEIQSNIRMFNTSW